MWSQVWSMHHVIAVSNDGNGCQWHSSWLLLPHDQQLKVYKGNSTVNFLSLISLSGVNRKVGFSHWNESRLSAGLHWPPFSRSFGIGWEAWASGVTRVVKFPQTHLITAPSFCEREIPLHLNKKMIIFQTERTASVLFQSVSLTWLLSARVWRLIKATNDTAMSCCGTAVMRHRSGICTVDFLCPYLLYYFFVIKVTRSRKISDVTSSLLIPSSPRCAAPVTCKTSLHASESLKSQSCTIHEWVYWISPGWCITSLYTSRTKTCWICAQEGLATSCHFFSKLNRVARLVSVSFLQGKDQ